VRDLGRLAGAEIRSAKEVLAFEATQILHGEEAAREAQQASRQLFGGGVSSDALPTTEIEATELETGIEAPVLFQRVGLCRSRSEARRLIQQRGARVNEEPVASVETCITLEDLVDGEIVLRAGKKRYHRIVAI
jgi:tyrosyl-tRNA synthetase